MRLLRGLGFFITTILMYLGIPLLGWGPGDIPGFFGASARLGYALVVLAAALAIGWQAIDAPEGIRGGKGQEDKLVARQSVIRVIVVSMLFAGLFFMPYAGRRGIGTLAGEPIVQWTGTVLFGLGISLVIWSGVALGRLYSADVTLQKDHHLVTSGPYRYLRHPRYAGGILFSVGFSLTFDTWIGLVVSAISIGMIMLRIRDEEILMKEAFGEEWEAYCARTRRLIPFVF